MGIDINLARTQADELSRQAAELRTAIKLLSEYKTSVKSSWKGKEVTRIISAIDFNISKLKKIINEIESLETDIVSSAEKIRQEEKAVAAKALAEKQQKIRLAREAYNTSLEKLDNLNEQKNRLVALYKTIPPTPENITHLMQLYNEYQELIKKIELSQKECDAALKNLNSVMR